MSVKPEKESANVVELDSSDNEDGVLGGKRRKVSMEQLLRPATGTQVSGSGTTPLTSSSNQAQTLEWRSFWKAGAYDFGPKKPCSALEVEHARVHPKFLHSNATSHKWAFGAIAELLDNAVDEIFHGATFVKVDKISNLKDNVPALLFQDNGGGMDPRCLRQCMSLGYSEKKANTTIGQYGNGFKTSTMRLGADAIVFTRTMCGSHATQSIGLLSYTFLRKTGQDDVIVPMVDFEFAENQRKPIIYTTQDDWSNNLNMIIEWSPFATNEELMRQFDDIGSHGTKIIIYNLWLNDDGLLELDFDNDEKDICLRDEVTRGKLSKKHDRIVESHISYRIRYSLRAYVSILYLKKFTNFQIILRGTPVEQYSIADELKHSKVIMYRPHLGSVSKEVSVETTIGFVKEAPLLPVSGFNVYHKNRLIRPFWRVTNDGNSRGNGVVGVLEANFIEPAHDKQDFERSSLFLRLETRLKQMIIDYWKSHFHLLGFQSPITDIRNMQKGCPTDQNLAGTATTQKELGIDHHVIGLSANVEKEIHLDQPVVGLAANLQQGMSKSQPIVGLAANFHDLSKGHHVIGLAADSKQGSPAADQGGSELVDQISNENIQLFMRCDEHRQKEINLRQMIEKLEAELEEMKKKCSLLVSHIEKQKRQKINKQQNEKA